MPCARSSRGSSAAPPWCLSARTVETKTTALGLSPPARQTMPNTGPSDGSRRHRTGRLPIAPRPLSEAHGGGRLALSRLRRGDARDTHQVAVRRIREPVDHRQRHLALVTPIRLDLLRLEPDPPRDRLDRLQLGALERSRDCSDETGLLGEGRRHRIACPDVRALEDSSHEAPRRSRPPVPRRRRRSALAVGCGEERRCDTRAPEPGHAREVERDPYAITCRDLARQALHRESTRLLIGAQFALAQDPVLAERVAEETLNRVGRRADESGLGRGPHLVATRAVAAHPNGHRLRSRALVVSHPLLRRLCSGGPKAGRAPESETATVG